MKANLTATHDKSPKYNVMPIEINTKHPYTYIMNKNILNGIHDKST